MRRSRRLATALMLAITLGACESAGTLEPLTQGSAPDPLDAILDAASSADPRGAGGGGGSLFDELAEQIPGFGGLYRTGRCAVAVVLTDMAEEKHAIQVVHAALAPLVACHGQVEVSAVQGQFTYLELQRFLAAARELLQLRGVHGIKVDYKQNRLVVTVAGREVAQTVLEALPRLGIPADAVTFTLGRESGRRDRSADARSRG